jgi:hypothetical protein
MELSRRTVVWLVPAFLALHNAEEAFNFRRGLPSLRGVVPEAFADVAARLTPAVVVQVLVALSVLAFGLAAVAVARPASRAALWLLLTLEVAVGLNVVAHLVSATLVLRGYSPGLATALLINAPFAVYCMRRARREQWLSPTALLATLPAAIMLHGPVLLGGLWLAAHLGG